MRMHHDMGGLPGGAIEAAEHDPAPWEKLVDAMFVLLSTRHREIFRVDELRRNIESLAPDVYDRLTYYQRWIAAISATLQQHGVITADELEQKMAVVEARLRAEHGDE